MATSVWAGPVTLQARTLLERPGVIAVDPKNVTTIQFCDQILWSAFKAALKTLPVLPDLPLLLPHVLSTTEVLTIRLDLTNEDAASLVRAEIVGPADQAKVLFEHQSR